MLLPLGNLFGPENWIFIALVALLLFGRRLPEVGRSLGKGITEFKKGLQGIEEDIDTASTQPQQPVKRAIADQSATAALPNEYKFDPYTGKPIEPAPRQKRFDPYTGKPLDEADQSTSS